MPTVKITYPIIGFTVTRVLASNAEANRLVTLASKIKENPDCDCDVKIEVTD